MAQSHTSKQPSDWPSSSHRMRGRLDLYLTRNEAAAPTVLTVRAQRPPLKVVRAFALDDGAALVHLHNVSGGVLGGDHLELIVEVGAGASAQLTTTGATRLYRCAPNSPMAQQMNKVTVREGGLLEYLPDALIPFAGARYRQETQIELAPGAGLFWWETIAPGRAARGELFAFERMEIKLNIFALGKRIAAESNGLEPQRRALTSSARLGTYRYFTNFYICRAGLEATRWWAWEKELSELADQLSRPTEILWGVSTLPAHGLIVRAVSVTGRAIAPGLLAFWRAAKQRLYGRAAVLPRKVY